MIRLVRGFVLQCFCYHILLVAEHALGVINNMADAPPHFQEFRLRGLAPQANLESTAMPLDLWSLGRERARGLLGHFYHQVRELLIVGI